MKNSKHRFLTELQKLKESSRHAVMDASDYELDVLKEYLHIVRPVETQLKEIILKSSQSENAQLILVCGNVGDGKSHVLSYLNQTIPDALSKFVIHNDATEAFNPNESFVDTLLNILEGFKDTNIEGSNSKVVLAINLGTLNNFLDQQEHEFRKLMNYVEDKHILNSDKIEDGEFEATSHFQYVNFTDYQLYELTNEGAKSSLLSELLSKIANQSEKNPLFSNYLSFKQQIQSYNNPIVYNYKFLFSSVNREIIIQLIIKAIIKSKEIISLRSILNFIYDIIIPVEYRFETNNALEKHLKSQSSLSFVKNIIPNYLFEHPNLSKLFEKIAKEDPCNFRSEKMDDNIIEVTNSEKIDELFKREISQDLLLEKLPSILQDLKNSTSGKREANYFISKSYIRLLHFAKADTKENDEYYQKFISFLFAFNNGLRADYRELYRIVDKACENWNGNPGKVKRVIINVGNKQTKYRILIPFETKASIRIHNREPQNVLEKFNTQLNVQYKDKQGNAIGLYIDYGLLKLLIKVTKGYRPNKLDKQSYISFILFLERLINAGDENVRLEVDEVNIGKSVDYFISFEDSFGDEFSFEEN